MRQRAHRVLFRVSEIFDYRTFVVAGAFALLVLVGYLMVGAIQGAHDATVTANQRGKAATRRIDGLQATIARQGDEIADLKARQAASAARQEALAHQVQQLGGQPVVSPEAAPRFVPGPTQQPSARPSASRTPRPFPSPSPSPSPTRSPTPRPSPTCLVPLLGCR